MTVNVQDIFKTGTTFIIVRDVDCESVEPGYSYPIGSGYAEAPFLGCADVD
jgi:hypothetical protein